MNTRPLSIMLLIVITLTNLSEAWAQHSWFGSREEKEEAKQEIKYDRTAILPGLILGGTLSHDEQESPGFFLGGEVSMWRYGMDSFMPSAAIGGYVDGLWDYGLKSLRMSAGPGIASSFIGFDCGFLIQRYDDRIGYGVAGRMFLSALVSGVFLRGGTTWGDADSSFVELGMTLKIPLL